MEELDKNSVWEADTALTVEERIAACGEWELYNKGLWPRVSPYTVAPDMFARQCVRYQTYGIGEEEILESLRSFLNGASRAGVMPSAICQYLLSECYAVKNLVFEDEKGRNILCDHVLENIPRVASAHPEILPSELSVLDFVLNRDDVEESNRRAEYAPTAVQAINTALPILWTLIVREKADLDTLSDSDPSAVIALLHANSVLTLIGDCTLDDREAGMQLCEKHTEHIENTLKFLVQAGMPEQFLRYPYGNIIAVAARFGGGHIRDQVWQLDNDHAHQFIHTLALPLVSKCIEQIYKDSGETWTETINQTIKRQQRNVRRNGLRDGGGLGTDDLGVAFQMVCALRRFPISDNEALTCATRRMVEIYEEHAARLETPPKGCPYNAGHLAEYVRRQVAPEVAALLQPNRKQGAAAPIADRQVIVPR